MSLHAPPRHRPTTGGLTLVEAVWLVLLAGAIVAVILGTLARDAHRADAIRTRDALGYLERLLRRELPPDAPLPLAGPGELPVGLSGAAAPLADHLPQGIFLPVDPWGRAYVVLRRNRDGRPWRVVASGGPAGRLGEPAWERALAPEP